jgi:hypothetical protein
MIDEIKAFALTNKIMSESASEIESRGSPLPRHPPVHACPVIAANFWRGISPKRQDARRTTSCQRAFPSGLTGLRGVPRRPCVDATVLKQGEGCPCRGTVAVDDFVREYATVWISKWIVKWIVTNGSSQIDRATLACDNRAPT